MFSNGIDSLDVLLAYMQRNEMSTYPSSSEELKGCHFPYHKYAVVKGRFAFQVHQHDTGNCVRAYILTDYKPYEIVSATFWKRSGYEHNSYKWETGAWGESLNKIIQEMKNEVTSHKKAVEARNNKDKAEAEESQSIHKQLAESYFK